ncbi:LYR family protein [Magnaporthiopsis poae ATCC 64411]|uniref:LYR family protein n=1 Tax=Magnaporthiopsis poae (strain ATCC 64411 / 73-15) TaxID=644358 RepID=A0A0C4DWA2_MAGP6|nr:LYR family protein [Magnaporthiopsis poae ATCC 64411]
MLPSPNPVLRREVIAIYKGESLPCDFHPLPVSFQPTSPTGSALPKSTSYPNLPSISIELLNLGKDYPLGFAYFRPRLHKAFMSNAHLRDEGEIRKGISRAQFVQKGM